MNLKRIAGIAVLIVLIVTACPGWGEGTALGGESMISAVSEEESRLVDSMFLSDSAEESLPLLRASAEFSRSAYSEEKVISELQRNGFTDVATRYYDGGKHTCAAAIGWKEIADRDGNPKRLIAVLCRGTVTGAEWASNFAMGLGDFHFGFYQAAEQVYQWLCEDYLEPLLAQGVQAEDILIWTTGHSRGAAAANLLAGYFLEDRFSERQVYCYTFASPNVVRGGDVRRDNIHNYILGGDLVARVPLTEWGYGRYGHSHICHNGETLCDIPVIDEGTMTALCQLLASREIMDEIEEKMTGDDASWAKLQEILAGYALKHIDVLSGLIEAGLYMVSTHTTSTYIAAVSGVLEDAYWSDGYLRRDDSPAPKDFQGSAVSATAIELSWAPADGPAYYMIRCDKAMRADRKIAVVTNDTSAVITGLEPDTAYGFDLCVMHDGVISEVSNTLYLHTDSMNLRCTDVSAASVTLAWDAADGYDAYEVRFGKAYSVSWSGEIQTEGTGITIDGLEPGKKYTFDVCAVKDGQRTKRSDKLRVSTSDAEPGTGF